MREERAKVIDEGREREANWGRGTAEPLGNWRRRRKLFEQRSLGSAHRSRHRCSIATIVPAFFFLLFYLFLPQIIIPIQLSSIAHEIGFG